MRRLANHGWGRVLRGFQATYKIKAQSLGRVKLRGGAKTVQLLKWILNQVPDREGRELMIGAACAAAFAILLVIIGRLF